MAVSWRHDQLDPPRPVSAPAVLTNRHQAVQSSRRRRGTRCRAGCSRGAAREDWRNHGAHSRMRRARGQPRPRRMDDGNRDAGVHEGEPEQGVRPHLVGRDRLVQARQEAPGFEGVRGRLHRVEERQGKIYRYEIPNHVLTMGAYPNTKMMTIPTGSTYFM